MASLINPSCATPLFQMTSQQTAEKCGKLGGMITSVVLSIIVSVVCIIFYVKSGHPASDNTPEQKRNTWILVGGATIIALLWLVVPYASGWISGRRFRGYADQVRNLMKQGYTRTKAMSKIQSLKQTQMRATATVMAGEEVAEAISGKF